MIDHQPNDLEDRIRDAYQSAARTVQTLQRPSPVLAAGSVRRPRRMNVLAPIAAAAAVIVVIAASVALPRLLAGAARNPAAPQISAPGHYPPFQLVVTYKANSGSSLQVESAATGHVVTTVALPWRGAVWGAVAAVGDTSRFIVAATPKPPSPMSRPTRLYTLTLSARGTVAGLTPLPVPVLQGQVTSLAASADGRTVAYTLVPLNAGADREVGIITGRTTRHWTIGGLTRSGAGTLGIFDVSVSSDGRMVAFTTQSQVQGYAAWVLPTGSAPGGITARARKVYELQPTHGGTRLAWLDSALISPDGSTLYLATSGNSASGKVVTALTAYRTAGGASPSTVTTFGGGYYEGLREVLTPAGGGMLLAWIPYVSTAYLINPATRTRTTLQLRGVPSLRPTPPSYLEGGVGLTW
ncbi:MAG: hypothetical protein ACRDOH_20440 [Streptosporangiaceae bacterium]